MLLNDLITLLSNESASITDILLKTKVFLHEIGKKDIVGWVNHELNGYPADVEIPPYRILHAEVRANLVSMTFRANSHPIPLRHLSEEHRKRLESYECRVSISMINEMVTRANGDKTDRLQISIPMEFNGLLGQKLADGVKINSAWSETSVDEMSNICAQVRSRLLDFLLELRDSLGHPISDQGLKASVAALDANQLFQNAVFGPNTTIIVGSHNSQTVTATNLAGDFEQLSKTLLSIGLGKADIESLQKAVSADSAAGKKPSLDGKVGHWYTGLLSRAVKGSAKVTVDVVSTGVAKAIAAYLGSPV